MLKVEDFPQMIFRPTINPIKLEFENLESVIRQTTFAHRDRNRPILRVKLCRPTKIVAIATDSFRLSHKFNDLPPILKTNSRTPLALDELIKIWNCLSDEV
jgi:DNA polymerase III sliding clamp (beta) subunit (PCNA family)